MTQKEQALEMVSVFLPHSNRWYDSDTKIEMRDAAKCAMIAVSYLIKFKSLHPMNWDENGQPIPQKEWWNGVLIELQKLKDYDIKKIS